MVHLLFKDAFYGSNKMFDLFICTLYVLHVDIYYV